MAKKDFLIFSTALGSALEYFDFVIFMMFSTYIGSVFFPQSTSFVARIETLSLFAVGYLARPIGGVLFGHFGDKLGRKACFTFSIMLMAISTLAIAFLPGYKTLGDSAAVALCLLRMLQGVAQGAELPGALTFISEHSPDKLRGWRCGLVTMSVGFGATFAALLSYILVSIFSTPHMVSFGWRIPFVLGGFVGVVGYVIRKNSKESPVFLEHQKRVKIPVVELIQKFPAQVVTGVFSTLFAACFIIFALYFPTYIHEYFHYPIQSIILAYTLSTLWSSVLIPFVGRLSDHVGRIRILYVTTLSAAVVMYFLFKLLSFETTKALYLFMFSYQTIIAFVAGCYPAMLAEIFPPHVRYSEVGFCYNVSFSIASLVPIIAAAVLHATHWPYVIAILFMVLSWVTSYSLRDRSVALSH